MPRHARGSRAVAPLTTAVLALLTAAPVAAGAAGDVPLIGRGAPGLGPVASGALTGAQARLADRTPAPDQYIVQLDAPPLARYQGGARGFPATAPSATGAKVDRDSAPARAWTRELDDRQAAV